MLVVEKEGLVITTNRSASAERCNDQLGTSNAQTADMRGMHRYTRNGVETVAASCCALRNDICPLSQGLEVVRHFLALQGSFNETNAHLTCDAVAILI
jgi:hypothetical protein